MRGRPKENVEPPKYPITMEDSDGNYLIYPNRVEFVSNAAFRKKTKEPVETPAKGIDPSNPGFKEYNDSLPKSARKYFNPKTNKWISYVGAKLAGII